MSAESVKKYLAGFGMDDRIQTLPESTATVALAAAAIGVEEARIAKSMSFAKKEGEGCILIVTAGDTKIDNKKFKAHFGFKAKMLSHDDALSITGHAVGGVCPFDLPLGVEVYLDDSLKRFTTIFPAAGYSDNMIELTCDELEHTASNFAGWIDVCSIK